VKKLPTPQLQRRSVVLKPLHLFVRVRLQFLSWALFEATVVGLEVAPAYVESDESSYPTVAGPIVIFHEVLNPSTSDSVHSHVYLSEWLLGPHEGRVQTD
jgi:hypothetical protein